ncbi:enoyl-CoA hydratase/isomerase family protein [Chloroflexota bacterium]
MEFKNIIYSKDEQKGIVKITVNRPEARNALNRATREELKAAAAILKEDREVRVVIITGAGDKAFIAGADVNDFKGKSPLGIDEYVANLGQQLYTDIENLPMPVIAMINGFCFGGGCELAQGCDIRIASENAKLGQPEINLGIIVGGGGTQRLPKLVGWGRAKELIYTGRIIDADEAERIGLVDKVVPYDELEIEVNKLAETIASKSPLIIRLAKQVINRGMYTDLAAGLSFERAMFDLCFTTEDHAEGIDAFLQKRKAKFKGR